MTLDEAKTEYLVARLAYNAACESGDRNKRWDAYHRRKLAECNLIDVATDKAAAATGQPLLSGKDYEAMIASPTARKAAAELSLQLCD